MLSESNALFFKVKSFLTLFHRQYYPPPLCIFRYILCTLYTYVWCTTFGSCSIDHNDVFLNGKNLKKKSMCTCAHFKIAALSYALLTILKAQTYCLLNNMTFLLSFSPNTTKPPINGTMLWVITLEKTVRKTITSFS